MFLSVPPQRKCPQNQLHTETDLRQNRTGLVSERKTVITGNVIMCAHPTLTSHLLSFSVLHYYYYYYHHHHYHHQIITTFSLTVDI
jgi:hypothetical protein